MPINWVWLFTFRSESSIVDAETRMRLELLEKEVERLRTAVEGPVQPWPTQAPSAPGSLRPHVSEGPPPAQATTATQAPSKPAGAPSLETRIGSRWLAVAGIVLFVFAAGLFLRLAINNGWIGPTAQILLGAVLGLAVWGFGIYLDRSKRLGEFAHVLAGGGVAITAFAAFAAYHFPKYQEALGIGLVTNSVLLVIIAVGALIDAVARRAQAQAVIAAVLGSLIPILALDLTMFSLALAVLMSFVLLVAATWRRWPAPTGLAALGPFLTLAAHAASNVAPWAILAAALTLLLGFTAVGLRVRHKSDVQAMAAIASQATVWIATWSIGVWALDQWNIEGAAWWTLGMGIAAGALAFLPGSDRVVRWTWGGLAIAGLIGFAPFLQWQTAVAVVWIAELFAVAAIRSVTRRLATIISASVLLGLLLMRLLSHSSWRILDRMEGWEMHVVIFLGAIGAAGAVWAVDWKLKGEDAILARVHFAAATGLALILVSVLATGPIVSLLWGIIAIALVGMGFALRRGDLRVAGLAAFALALLRIVARDLAGVDAIWRVAAFAGVGALLLVASWLYVRWSRRITIDREG